MAQWVKKKKRTVQNSRDIHEKGPHHIQLPHICHDTEMSLHTGHVHKRPKHKHCATSELKARCACFLERDFETPRTYKVIEKLLQIASPSYHKNPQLIFTMHMMIIRKT